MEKGELLLSQSWVVKAGPKCPVRNPFRLSLLIKTTISSVYIIFAKQDTIKSLCFMMFMVRIGFETMIYGPSKNLWLAFHSLPYSR